MSAPILRRPPIASTRSIAPEKGGNAVQLRARRRGNGMTSTTSAAAYPSAPEVAPSTRSGRLDDELLRIARGHKGDDTPLVERDGDGSFDEYLSQWLVLDENESSPDLVRGEKSEPDVDVLGFTYSRYSFDFESDNEQPERPQERGIDVDVSEYEMETDSNASTPPHIREQRERELEEMRLEEERIQAEVERKRLDEEERKKAEEERIRLEEEERLRLKEEERKVEEERLRLLEEERKAEEERIRLEEEERKVEEARLAEEERLRAEEEERMRIAEEEAAAARAKKAEMKAMVQSVLAEERDVPARRNSSWTKAEAKKSILKNRHSIAPIAMNGSQESPLEEEEGDDGAEKEILEVDPEGLVDYESDGSVYTRRLSVRSTKSPRESVLFTSKSQKRVSIARGTQPEKLPLVDYDQTPAAKSAKGVSPAFSLPYDSASSFQTTPGSRAGSIGEGSSSRVRKRLDVDLGDVGVPESKLKRFRRQSEVCAPARTMEKGTLCRESLGSPEMLSKKIAKAKNMVDCAIMCRGEEIDAEIAIMFGEFKLSTSDGVDIPPLDKHAVAATVAVDEEEVDQIDSGNNTTSRKEAPIPEPEPISTHEPPQPKITFVEQAVSVQTPGKTVTHNVSESILENEPASALRDNERMVAEFGGDDAAKVRVVEIVDETQSQNLPDENAEADYSSDSSGTPNSVAATIASSRRASIATLPSNPTPTRKTRSFIKSASTAPESDRKTRLMVSAAKPPKSPKSPSIAAMSSARRTRRSLRFAQSPPLRRTEAGSMGQAAQLADASPEICPQDPSPSPAKGSPLDYNAEAENVTPNLQMKNTDNVQSKKMDASPRIDSVIKCASFVIPQNRLSMQKAPASRQKRKSRSLKKRLAADDAAKMLDFNPIPFVPCDELAAQSEIQSNVLEVEITETELRKRDSMVQTRKSTRPSTARQSPKCAVVSNVLSFEFPQLQAVNVFRDDADDDIDNGDMEDVEDQVDVAGPPKRKSTRARKSSVQGKTNSSVVESKTTRSMSTRRTTSGLAKKHNSNVDNVSMRSTRSTTRSQKLRESAVSPATIKDSSDVLPNGRRRRSTRRGSAASSRNNSQVVEVVEEDPIRNVPNGRRRSSRRTRGSSSTSAGNSQGAEDESVGSSSRKRSTRKRRSLAPSKSIGEEQVPDPPAGDFEENYIDDDDAQIPVGSPFQFEIGHHSDDAVQEVELPISEQEPKKRSASKRGRKRNRRVGDRPLQRELANLERPTEESDEDDGSRRVRRGKRARFQPLKFWENEKPVYERRDSQIMPTIKQLNLAIDPRATGNEESEKVAIPDEPVQIAPGPDEEEEDEFVVVGDPLSPEGGEVIENQPMRTRKSAKNGVAREVSSSSSAQVGPWRVTPEKEQPAKKKRKRRKRY